MTGGALPHSICPNVMNRNPEKVPGSPAGLPGFPDSYQLPGRLTRQTLPKSHKVELSWLKRNKRGKSRGKENRSFESKREPALQGLRTSPRKGRMSH